MINETIAKYDRCGNDHVAIETFMKVVAIIRLQINTK
jgi:hypothetical protein